MPALRKAPIRHGYERPLEQQIHMEIVHSKNGVPIRLTEERWLHITEEHSEMAGYYLSVTYLRILLSFRTNVRNLSV